MYALAMKTIQFHVRAEIFTAFILRIWTSGMLHNVAG